MLNIKPLIVNPLQENCYIVSDDTHEAVVIDCGAYFDVERTAVADYIRNHGLTLRHLLCTHGHFDHCYGNDTIFAEFGIAPEVHTADSDYVEHMDRQYLELMGEVYHRPSIKAARLLADGDTVNFGSHTLHVIHTPGHSPGSVVFHCPEEHVAFTGDTIFRMSVGRTDLPGGSWTLLQKSLGRLATLLPTDTTLYPGHGPASIMDEERQFNPYLQNQG